MGASNVRVFGSVLHGDDRPDSDVDLLVEVEPGRSLLDIIGLEQELEQLLGRRVEVLTVGGLSPLPGATNARRSSRIAKDHRVYLEHVRDALGDIATYTNVGREAFFADRMRQDATLRKLQVIGEAVKNLSEDIKSCQPQIR